MMRVKKSPPGRDRERCIAKDAQIAGLLARGAYHATKDGRVFRCGETARELSQYTTRSGYRFVTLMSQPRPIKCAVHRIVAIQYLGMPPRYMEVNHKNGLKVDNRLVNIEWCTPKENKDHAFSTGLSNIGAGGEDHNYAKLTDREADAIRRIWLSGKLSQAELSEFYRLSLTEISKVCRGRRGRGKGTGA